jgi:hypothetical protein
MKGSSHIEADRKCGGHLGKGDFELILVPGFGRPRDFRMTDFEFRMKESLQMEVRPKNGGNLELRELIRVPGFGRYRKATVGIGRLRKFRMTNCEFQIGTQISNCQIFKLSNRDAEEYRFGIGRDVAVGGYRQLAAVQKTEFRIQKAGVGMKTRRIQFPGLEWKRSCIGGLDCFERTAGCKPAIRQIINLRYKKETPFRASLVTDKNMFEERELVGLALVLRDGVVDFVGPGVDAAFDALDVFEALFAEELQGLHGTDAALAVDVQLLVGVEFGEAVREFAERYLWNAVNVTDFVFVRIADVDDLDVELGIIEGALHVLDGDFIRVRGGDFGFRRDAAEDFVVDEFLDGRMVAADGALGVAAELELAELHVEGVEEHEASGEGGAFAEGDLQNFGGLDAADDAREDAEDAAFRAAGNHAGWRGFGIEAAIAGSAKVRSEDAGLAFKTENGTVDVGFLEENAGVVGEVTGREIIGAVDDDIVLADDVEGVFAGKPGVMDDDFAGGVDAVDGFLGGFSLGTSDVRGGVNDLALEIGEIDGVEVDNADFADTCGGEIHRYGGTEAAGADAKDAGGADFLLSGQTDFWQDQVAGVPPDLVIV